MILRYNQANLGFLVMTLKIMYKNRNNAKSKKGSLWYVYMHDCSSKSYISLMWPHRYWFKGCFTLIISMGITWVFGLVALHELLLPFIYLFAIFTSIQVWVHPYLVSIIYCLPAGCMDFHLVCSLISSSK